MSVKLLQFIALVTYLLSWLAFGMAALWGALSRRHRQSATQQQITPAVIAGTFLQGAAFASITLSLPDGPLRPAAVESAAALVLAPLAVLLHVWTLLTTPREPAAIGDAGLVTSGPFRWIRHPMYLAFLLMLLATAFLASTGVKMLAALGLYLVGSELRIASEEADLLARFPEQYPAYRQRTAWRYLPGLR